MAKPLSAKSRVIREALTIRRNFKRGVYGAGLPCAA
jgi:hypothetical protein